MGSAKDIIRQAKLVSDFNLLVDPDSQDHPIVLVIDPVGSAQERVAYKFQLSFVRSLRDILTDLIRAVEVVNDHREMPEDEDPDD